MRTGSSVILVDTNVLVYAYDPRDQFKQARAIEALDTLIDQGLTTLSVQCLSEFFRAVTQRLPKALPPADALAQVEVYIRSCVVHQLTPIAILRGCDLSVRYQVAIWDSLIWAVAKLNDIPTILTEDMAHGRVLEGVRYLNPFLPEFDLDRLTRGAR